VTVREYREIEACERMPDVDTWERMCEVFGWPQRFEGRGETPQAGSVAPASSVALRMFLNR
jgi:hypothetical protein